MGIDPDHLGIQTYSFRAFAPLEIPRLVRACGLGHVELCTMQVPLEHPERTAALVAAYRAAGVTIDALGVHALGSSNDEAVCALARQVGARVLGVDAPVTLESGFWRNAARLAERHGLRFAIHNHGGYHWLGSAQALEHVLAHTNAAIGVCLDTAWAMHAGEDPIALVTRFGRRIYGVHVKDFVFARDGRVSDIVIGEGNLKLGALAAALEAIGFDGYAALEYEGEPDDPTPAIRACVAAAHRELCHA